MNWTIGITALIWLAIAVVARYKKLPGIAVLGAVLLAALCIAVAIKIP